MIPMDNFPWGVLLDMSASRIEMSPCNGKKNILNMHDTKFRTL